MILFIILFVLGRVVSLILYRMCWSNGISGKFAAKSAILTLLRRPLWGLVHFAIMWPLLGMTWENWPLLQGVSAMLAGLLALGAVGRFGSADLGLFFFLDRLVVLVLAAGVLFSPVFLYPCLVACCCVQYTVASWRLGPGYSNLLGYEFVRLSLSSVIACFTVCGWMRLAGLRWDDFESLTLAVLLALQASTYVNHALAKSALGPKWNSWICENRIQCLGANAWLRGWTLGRSQACVLNQTRWLERHRVKVCAAAWLLEISWIFILGDSRLAVVILGATALTHLGIFAMTGLISYQYGANHLLLLAIIIFCNTDQIFGYDNLAACAIVVPAAAIWIGWLRYRIFTNYQLTGAAGIHGLFADAADHLMAWWDTPLMRMYSYTVKTRTGEDFALPVTKLSPHDTTLTDIHTHLMILGLHGDLDARIAPDRGIARTGVWGLVVDRGDRDFLYRLMDDATADFQTILSPKVLSHPWALNEEPGEPEAAAPLRALFAGLNRAIEKRWFRIMLRWPHFPGEDLAPDLCPLDPSQMKCFHFDQAIASVTVWRVKTFYQPHEMMLIEREIVGRIDLE